MHLCMIIWYYRVPCGYRRKMEEKDLNYRNQIKLQRSSNGYLIKMNAKDKSANKDRIVEF